VSLRTSSKSSLFLIEMIVVILFFSIAGAICVSLFVQARLISLESTRLTLAVNQCQNAAEALRAVGMTPMRSTNCWAPAGWR
jgi:type II secretory pathway pseudopilin PulG